MAASYTVRTAALAAEVSHKWVDNLLSHHDLPGVSGGRQGLERSISMTGMLAIEVVRLATLELGMTTARAVYVATQLLESDARHVVRTESGIELTFPIALIERRLRERLVEAVEAVPSVSRGRPRVHETKTPDV